MNYTNLVLLYISLISLLFKYEFVKYKISIAQIRANVYESRLLRQKNSEEKITHKYVYYLLCCVYVCACGYLEKVQLNLLLITKLFIFVLRQ